MTTVPALDRRTLPERWSDVRDEEALWGDLRPELLAAIRTVLETTMESELWERLRAARYERTACRRGHRNGTYRRSLVTELGLIADLAIPRARGLAYRPSFLARAARRTTTVDDVLRQAFLRGLSVRETAALAETLTGVALSAAAVSRLARALDAQVAAFHRRRIASPVRYLVCDGLWVTVRGSAGRATERVILAVYGIDADGRRELLDYRQATAESAAAWGALLRSLVARGLDPDAVVLVTADGAGGIAAAVAEAFPDAALQRCWTHRVRNILEALPLAERRACLAGLRRIYRARTRRAAVAAYWTWARRWRTRHPRIVAGLERDLDALLAVFSLPEPLRTSLRTTNLIERAFRELRRRIRPIGALPGRRSADRIIHGQVVRLNGLLAARPLPAFTQES
ncbi:MAG: IS256 family transposase [Thermoleophilia bacterium]|nr:IS256 family transposase [Thermoleophilia bacterium]